MTRRLRATVGLLGPTLRLVPWWHVAGGAAIATALLLATRGNPDLGVAAAVDVTRLAMVPLAVSVAFVLDDPTSQIANATPLPLFARRGLRVGVVTTVVAAVWAGTLLLIGSAPGLNEPVETEGVSSATTDTDLHPASTDDRDGTEETKPVASLPSGMLTLEFAALAGLTLAVAASANRRHRDAPGGLVAAPTALGAAATAAMLPAPVALFTPYATRPADPAEPTIDWLAWVAAHQRWGLVGVAGLLTLMLAIRDPARRLVPQLHAARKAATSTREPAATPTGST